MQGDLFRMEAWVLVDVRERERGDARELGFSQVEGDFDSFVGRWVVTPRCVSGYPSPFRLPQTEHWHRYRLSTCRVRASGVSPRYASL